MTVTLEKVRFTEAETGCYLDGHFGWHNTYRVIELAQSNGFHVSDEDQLAVDAYAADAADDFQAEVVIELSDAATDHLQSVTAEGLSWVWDMGELCLWVDDPEEEL